MSRIIQVRVFQKTQEVEKYSNISVERDIEWYKIFIQISISRVIIRYKIYMHGKFCCSKVA